MASYAEWLGRQVQAAVMKKVFQKYVSIKAGDISGESVILDSQWEMPWYVELKVIKCVTEKPLGGYDAHLDGLWQQEMFAKFWRENVVQDQPP
jgi:hypothetical protein